MDDDLYKKSLAELMEARDNVIKLSQKLGGLHGCSSRQVTASVLFTRLTVMAVSMVHILPLNDSDQELWDFSAVASLCRNLIECYLVFYYLVVEDISEDEAYCRQQLVNLHDCTSRIRLFEHMQLAFGDDDASLQENIDGFKEQKKELECQAPKIWSSL